MRASQSAFVPDLPDISAVHAFESNDEALFHELRNVLQKYNALSRFGIALLHSHFPVAEDEILVESVDVRNRVLTTTVFNRVDVSGTRVIETNWRLDLPTAMVACNKACVTQNNGLDTEPYHIMVHKAEPDDLAIDA